MKYIYMNISLDLFDVTESQMKTGRIFLKFFKFSIKAHAINVTVFKNEAIDLDNDDQVST